MTSETVREGVPEPANPIGFDGIEFIEFATSKPQALGGMLELMGFRPDRAPSLARGRAVSPGQDEHHRQRPAGGRPAHGAADRAADHQRLRGARARCRRRPSAARSISAHGKSRCGRGRWSSTFPRYTASAKASSISSTATTSSRSTTSISAPFPTSTRIRPRLAGMHFFGIVQYIGADRTADWVEFYSQIFGFTPLPDSKFASASCPRDCCSRARAATSTCS